MLIFGIVLLLPGSCSVVFVLRLLSDRSADWHHPVMMLLGPLWAVTILLAIGGIFIIRAAVRRS
jgi:hypothetical protein